MKIAIIEDDPNYLKSMARLLSEAGHEVLPVLVEGQDAKALADTVNGISPDIVLLDHQLRDREAAATYGGELEGDAVALLLSLPKEKLVGTSTSVAQPYCGARFHVKDELGNHGHDRARRGLLTLIGSFAG